MAERDTARLFGYLLGTLDAEERQQLDQRLAWDPRLQRRLMRAKARLQRLRAAGRRFSPPPGLAQRTCRLVALFARPSAAEPDRRQSPAPYPPPPRPRAERMSPATVPPSSSAGWRWTDLMMAAAILVLASLAVFPAIQTARSRARLASCQDHLRHLGIQVAECRQQHPALASGSSNRFHARGFSQQAAPPAGGLVLGHEGINPAAFGPNVLFSDGRVTFVCTSMFSPENEDLPFQAAPIDSLPIAPAAPPTISLVRGTVGAGW